MYVYSILVILLPRFKNTIGNENSSAMFYAAYFDMPYLLEFLIKLEQGQQGG